MRRQNYVLYVFISHGLHWRSIKVASFEYVITFDTFSGYKIREKITGKKQHVITKTLIFIPVLEPV